jgi:hypothetical protein
MYSDLCDDEGRWREGATYNDIGGEEGKNCRCGMDTTDKRHCGVDL